MNLVKRGGWREMIEVGLREENGEEREEVQGKTSPVAAAVWAALS